MKWFFFVLVIFLFIRCDSCDGFRKPLSSAKQLLLSSCTDKRPNYLGKSRDGSRLFPSNHVILASAGSVPVSSALNPTVFGGILSGGLHAVTGPDHIAALVPSSVGKSALHGAKIGALWGLGHGISATLMGLCFFFLKDQLSSKFISIEKLTQYAESAVGISLVAIGLMGIKESMEKDDHPHDANVADPQNPAKAIFANGLLHGFSLDGAPSLAPTIVLSSWKKAFFFLMSYSLGTMFAMTIVSSVIAQLSTRLGKIANRPDLPKKLSLVSSLSALLIGLYWVIRSYFL